MNKAIQSSVLNVEIINTTPIGGKLNWFEKLIAKVFKTKVVYTNHYKCKFTISLPNYYKSNDIIVSSSNCIGWQILEVNTDSIIVVTLKPVEVSIPITTISKIMLISSTYNEGR